MYKICINKIISSKSLAFVVSNQCIYISIQLYRPQANLCSVQVGSSYRGTKIYLHKLVHSSEHILKLKVLHLFCSHFREFLH